ncbi:MAG: hypothetical protein JWQ26_3619, partial [Modestobacter sp.]|nr:hypothetical protein [Modestobacter sp.]
ASQTIVPTLTMFGRVRECTREVSKVLLATGAVVTGSSWHRDSSPTTWGGTGVADLTEPARRAAGAWVGCH